MLNEQILSERLEIHFIYSKNVLYICGGFEYFCKCGVTKTFANKCILEQILAQKREFKNCVYTNQYFTY